jgi:hypothetical protein
LATAIVIALREIETPAGKRKNLPTQCSPFEASSRLWQGKAGFGRKAQAPFSRIHDPSVNNVLN